MPNSIIFTINIVLFVLTVQKIRRIQADIISIMSRDRCSHFYQNCLINKNNKYINRIIKIQQALMIDINVFFNRLSLFVRLFITMGLSWILLDIMSLIAMEFGDSYLRDSCYILKGVFIFMQFVMNCRVLCLIKRRFVYL